MARPHRIHGFRSLIAIETLQPAYRVIPDIHSAGADCKSFRSNVFRNDLAAGPRKSIQSAAARIVGVVARPSNDDAVDAGRKLRGPATVEAQSDQAPQKSSRDGLGERLR